MAKNFIFENDDELLKQGYTKEQVREIQEGVAQNVDVSIYLNKLYIPIQMRQIRLGLEENLPVELYASLEYDSFQMEEIRKGLRDGIDVEVYLSNTIPFDKMREIRLGLKKGIELIPYLDYAANFIKEIRLALEQGIDIIPFIDDGYDIEQLPYIRDALKRKIDISKYIKKEFCGPAIREVMLGLMGNQDVSLYAKNSYSWQQMREIRLGIKNRVNIEKYNNTFYNWKQMRQVRLGLEVGLDVSSYNKYMYTAKEMEIKRNRLLLKSRNNKPTYLDESEDLVIKISADEMKAWVKILHAGKNYTKEDIILELNENGIVEGISEKGIQKLIKTKGNDEFIAIANGTKPVDGTDGWYEFYFDVENKITPKLLPDGSVDYQQGRWYQATKQGETLAYYHIATNGIDGKTVMGRTIFAKSGKEKGELMLSGCELEDDNQTYVATTSGKVELKGSKLSVINTLELDMVTFSTGNVDFEGNVYVKGNVGSGSTIKAKGDVVIGGCVESATIISEGNIEIRLGVNAPEKGYIEAGGSIAAKYFENAVIKSKKDIHANYILNCDVECDGQIIIDGSKGTITGGETYARFGIVTGNLGNSIRVQTKISAGVNERILDSLLEKNNKIKEIRNELLMLYNAFEDMNEKYSVIEKANSELYNKVHKSIIIYEKRLTKILDEKDKIEKVIEATKDAKIVVKGILNEGVIFNINGSVWEATEQRNVIVENSFTNVNIISSKK